VQDKRKILAWLFLPKSTDRRSIKRAVKPLPVPPPKLWKIRKPCVVIVNYSFVNTLISNHKIVNNLEPLAIFSETSKTIHTHIDHLFSDGVVTTGVVIGRILFSGEQLLGMKELP